MATVEALLEAFLTSIDRHLDRRLQSIERLLLNLVLTTDGALWAGQQGPAGNAPALSTTKSAIHTNSLTRPVAARVRVVTTGTNALDVIAENGLARRLDLTVAGNVTDPIIVPPLNSLYAQATAAPGAAVVRVDIFDPGYDPEGRQ